MSEIGHWIWTKTLGENSFTFNLDTIFTMWFAMGVLIVIAFIATRRLSLVPGKFQAVCENILSTSAQNYSPAKRRTCVTDKRHQPNRGTRDYRSCLLCWCRNHCEKRQIPAPRGFVCGNCYDACRTFGNGNKTFKFGNPSFCKRFCRRNFGNISTRSVCIPCAAAGYVL